MPCHTRAAIAFRCSKPKPSPRFACRGAERCQIGVDLNLTHDTPAQSRQNRAYFLIY
jgi:hypothetical protein